MPRNDDGSLCCTIELDKTSGEFEMQEDGYTRFIPSKEKLDYLNRWLGDQLDKSERNLKPRWDECAANAEAYKPIKKNLRNDGGQSVLPAATSRNPADQIISNTVNVVMRSSPIVSFDAYFEEDYPVIVPVDPQDVIAQGVNLEDPTRTAPLPTSQMVDSETIANRFEHCVEFKNRERLDFEGNFHKIVESCVVGKSPVYWKTYAEPKNRYIIAPKLKTPFIDVEDEEEREVAEEVVRWLVVPYNNVLVSSIDQTPDDLDMLAERDPQNMPDDVTRRYENGEFFLIENDEDCQKCACSTSGVIEETKARTDATTKNYEPETPDPFCDLWEVWFYAYLKMKAEGDAKPRVRRFSLMGTYHRGCRKLLSVMRNPYKHQRRIHVGFTQFLDGSSTVGITRHAQELQTYLIQAEVKSSFVANNPLYWYDPNAYDTAEWFRKRTEPLTAATMVPGKVDVDWGPVRGGFEHYSLLGLIQWNAGTAQESSKQSDYEQGNRVVSHTSPQVVNSMLDRGGQSQILFLRLLNRGVSEVMRLYLETARQYQPMGENIPVKNPETEAIIMVPFRFPIGEVLDNFRISLTAAEEAASRERDPEQMAMALQLHQQHTGFFAQVLQAMRDPSSTPEDVAFFRKTLEGAQALYDRIIATTRADERKFNLMPEVDSIIAEKTKAMEAMKNAQQSQAPPTAGALPAPEQGADIGESSGVGGEPGVAENPAPVAPTSGPTSF